MGRGLCKRCYQKQRYLGDGGKTKTRMAAYSAAHPAQRQAIWRKHAYGLTEAEWQALYRAHRGCCAICRKPEPINVLNVDHDHATGQVRGLLCGHCNKALGLMCDDPRLFDKGAHYLRRQLMSKKRDPIFQVMDFFEAAPLAVAQSTFSLVQRTVRKRTAAEAPPAPAKRRRGPNKVQPPASAPTPTPVDPPSPAAPATRRRRGAAATPTGPSALPGLGPSTVGD
jgi:Recombination endonuclease VII